MVEVRQTEEYKKWFKSLRDHNARGRIDVRVSESCGQRSFGTADRLWPRVIGFISLKAEHLDSEEAVAAYLEATLEDGDASLIASVLGDIARARGMTQLARETGLGRESLYKVLSPEGNPSFATIAKVISALGLRLHASPMNE